MLIMTTIAPERKNIISLRSSIRLNTLKIKKAREAIAKAHQEITIAEERRNQAEEQLKALEEVENKQVIIFSTKGSGEYNDHLQRKGKKTVVH